MRYIRLSDLALSTRGEPIDVFASSSLNELAAQRQRPILLIGGVHGDEPEGVRLAQDVLDDLTRTRDWAPAVPWVVIPCLNVDGFRMRSRVNGRGVDLNRNYPSPDWSPNYTKERYHPGSAPGSEPEVQLVIRLISLLKPQLIVHCHSWQPCIVATGAQALRDGRRLAQSSGYELTPEIGYPTPGSLSRYGWHHLGLPVICIEEQEHLAEHASIWPRFKPAFREIFSDPSSRTN